MKGFVLLVLVFTIVTSGFAEDAKPVNPGEEIGDIQVENVADGTSRPVVGIGESMHLWVEKPDPFDPVRDRAVHPDGLDSMGGIAWGLHAGSGTLIPTVGHRVLLTAEVSDDGKDLSVSVYLPRALAPRKADVPTTQPAPEAEAQAKPIVQPPVTQPAANTR